MRKASLGVILALLLSSLAFCAVQADYITLAVTGATGSFVNDYAAESTTFAEIPSGTVSAVSITIQGCVYGATGVADGSLCDSAADTNTGTTQAIRSVTFGKVYDYFWIAGTWTGSGTWTIRLKAVSGGASSGSGGAINSVFGRTGTVTAESGDYTVSEVTNAVANTTTVNGHALSANVTVSASDLTTGTLPHAQLPTLLSGDIPNNAANTTGNAATANAAAGTPGLCPTGQAPTGILANFGATGCAAIGGGIGYPSGSGFAIVSASNAWGSTLADPLVVGHGGTGTASTLTGIVRGGSPLTASELSGDATTSGSNAVTVVKINGTSLAGLATGILKNTTTTGAPSIAAAGTDYQAPLTGTGLARNSGAATELSGVVTTSGSNVTSYAIANTTFTVSNATFSANTCTKLDSTAGSSTVTMTGMATSSVISIAPAADTATVVGFGTAGGLVIDAWPTSNTANLKVCNQTASGITTGATLVFNISAR